MALNSKSTRKMSSKTSTTESVSAPAPPSSIVEPAEPRLKTELVFKLSRTSDAQVTIYGDATQEAIAKLTALLELSKDTFPSAAEFIQPRAAIWHSDHCDQPVTVTGFQGEHDGRRYMRVADSGAAVPEDELEYVA